MVCLLLYLTWDCGRQEPIILLHTLAHMEPLLRLRVLRQEVYRKRWPPKDQVCQPQESHQRTCLLQLSTHKSALTVSGEKIQAAMHVERGR